MFATTQSLFNIKNSDFIKNFADVSSTIDALGVSSTGLNIIELCTFESNYANKNTISLNKARALISKTQFVENTATERTKNLFLGFSEVNITDCTFRSAPVNNQIKLAQQDKTMGAFIFVILDVKLQIQNSAFLNGIASYGGAIYLSGQSEMKITGCIFSSNIANVYGGAIYGNGFKSIKLERKTRLLNNIALSQGDDFFLSNTEDAFEMDEVTINNPKARNSIHAEYVQVKLNNVRITEINKNEKSEMGAAIQCLFCRRMIIENSYFGNLRSQLGGAIYLTDSVENKRNYGTDLQEKYIIRKSTFENIDAYVGGALYLDHPQSMIITDCNFNRLRANNRTTTKKTDLPSGIAGAINYICDDNDPLCNLTIDGTTTFSNNYAAIKGGAINWNYVEPNFGKQIKFSKNKAGWYGDNIAAYAQQLKAITKEEYKKQLERIYNPLQYSDNDTLSNNSTTRKLYFDESRALIIDNKTALLTDPELEKNSYNQTNVRSGGEVPQFFVAHVDKYGQIVAEFDNKIRVGLEDKGFKVDENTKKYTPILGGTQEFQSYGGVAAISGLEFSGAPGYEYKLNFISSAIDELLPENKDFKEKLAIDQIDFELDVGLRECKVGEYFNAVGKCIWCDPNQGYSLVAMKEPGDCKKCDSEKATCTGGNDIGPKPGYWRPSNSSSNFMRCPNPDVCLGWVAPTWNPMGQCAEGYTGVLCAECMAGYSLTGTAKCAKCPEMTSNIVKLVFMALLLVGMFSFMVRSTLNSASQPKNLTSVYMKILMNHFQLILLVSSFNFKWPSQLESFFASSSTVSEASTQIISVDCFLTSAKKIADLDQDYFSTFFVKLLIFALMPFLIALASYGFWAVHKCLKRVDAFQTAKFISTLVISLFIIHPNIVQTMFNNFNCKEIEGEKRAQQDYTVRCGQKIHNFWSYSVAMPSIIVWGLGIPFFAFILMYRERAKLDKVETKEKFGFLYNGYQVELFFWEIVIMYRKIAMIFIAVFIQPQGVITQAMIVFVIMIGFLIANLKKKPYVSMALNDLETFSLITSAISIYCGIFFIADVPSKDMASIPASVKGIINLSDTMRLFFFMVIMISNIVFFGYWAYKMLQEVRNTLVKKFEKIYLHVFLCGDKVKLDKMKNQQKIDEENEQLREKYYKQLSKLKQLYKDGKLVLTHQTLERALVYLNEDRYMDALGLAKRDITAKDQKRFARITQGALVKERERDKEMYGEEYRDTVDQKRKVQNTMGIRGNNGQHIAINEEFMHGGKMMLNEVYDDEIVKGRQKRQRGNFRNESTLSYNSHIGFISNGGDGPFGDIGSNRSGNDINQLTLGTHANFNGTQENLMLGGTSNLDEAIGRANGGHKVNSELAEQRNQGDYDKNGNNLDENWGNQSFNIEDQQDNAKQAQNNIHHTSTPQIEEKPKDKLYDNNTIETMIKQGDVQFKQQKQANSSVGFRVRNDTKKGAPPAKAMNQNRLRKGGAQELTVKIQPQTKKPTGQDKIDKDLKMFEKSDSMSSSEQDSSEDSDAIDAAIRQATKGDGSKKVSKTNNKKPRKNDESSELDYNNNDDGMFSDGESAKEKLEDKIQKKINQKKAW